MGHGALGISHESLSRQVLQSAGTPRPLRVTLLRRSPWSALLPKGEASAKGEDRYEDRQLLYLGRRQDRTASPHSLPFSPLQLPIAHCPLPIAHSSILNFEF